jgi:hypothetical protein
MSIRHRLSIEGVNTYLLGILLFSATMVGVLFLFPSSASAAPGKINYQGRLTNASGTLMSDGQYNMKFRIYSVASGGAALWTETRETTNRVTVTNGQFNVQLGAVTTIPDSVFAADTTYFEVELPTPASATCSTASCGVYTEGAMTPRQPVSSAAYALQANNASTLDGIDSTSFARNDASNTFSSSNTFNSTVTIGSTNSATKFVINDNSSAALFTADTSATIVKVGTTSAATLANVRLLSTSAEFTGTVRIGTATDGVDISGANGVLLSGTARRTQSIVLTPEYANSVLDASSGFSNIGSMTSNFDLTNRRNYYKWTTTSASAQYYDVVVQVPIPSDFSAWASATPMTLDVYSSSIASGYVLAEARDTAGAVVTGIDFAVIGPSSSNTWQTRSLGTVTGTYSSGGYMTLRLRMRAVQGTETRISNIKLDYLSKW